MVAIVLAVGALLGWLAVAFMHYSDSHDRQLARGVSALDSVTLVCVLAHFTFLLWTFGHLRELQRAEGEYKAAALAYNERAERKSADNARIAASAERIAAETTKAERLRNDSAYQLRKAAEAGRGISLPRPRTTPGVTAPTLATAPIELERPHAPAESSTAFLTRWDFWIRAANLAELLLAATTLIYSGFQLNEEPKIGFNDPHGLLIRPSYTNCLRCRSRRRNYVRDRRFVRR